MSAIRSLRQLAASSSRTFALRSTPAAARLRLPTIASRVAVSATRAFSVSARSFGEGASDVVLAQKLAEELQYEETALDNAKKEPEFLTSFKQSGIWNIDDTPGNDEVVLTRSFGNETVRLIFSIQDIQSQEQEPEFEEDAAEEQADDPIQSYGVRVAVSITKANAPGAMSVETVCQEGSFMVDAISFVKDAKVGTDLTVEADWKRRALYLGPQFDTLDISLQEEFQKYLQERGINESLALFIPEYAEYKEQKEYMGWLSQVKSFVEV